MADLLYTQEITIETQAGDSRVFVISKFPALAGREIVTQYPLSALPKIGDYAINEAMAKKILSYVEAVNKEGNRFRLNTEAMINNHVPDWETMAKIEKAMLAYNVSFFSKGKSSLSLKTFVQKARPLILSILTALQDQSSPKAAPPSTN